MTEKAKNFIYLLERNRAPKQDGYYYFESGFFSNPAWYRLNNRTSQWQITFDLVKWYNVVDINIELNIENLYIVNYLKIKEIRNNILIMNKNNDDFTNTICNSININVNNFVNEYNDNIITEIINNINEVNNNILNIKSQINELELDYQLRANKKNIESLKKNLIYYNAQFQYLKEDYYNRVIYLKNNCIKNSDMVLSVYTSMKDELELIKNALSITETKYVNLLKCNKNLNEDIKSNLNYITEQSMKMSALEIELKDKNDIIKNLKNDITISSNNYTLNLDHRINCLQNDNKIYKNKITDLESAIESNKNTINNLENIVKFYKDQETHNQSSKVKINQLELSKFNLERANEKLKIQTDNYINTEDNLQKKIQELREKLSIESESKSKIINDTQLLLKNKYSWNDEKQLFEENDFEILE